MMQANTMHTINNRCAYPAVDCVALRSCDTYRCGYDKLDRMFKEMHPLGQAIIYSDDILADMVA